MNDKKSLATEYPEIAKEWHPTKNGILKPTAVTAGSHKKVWWLGLCGHEWQATIKNRTAARTSCPYCSNRKVLSGFNDLATTNPTVAKEWNYNKNIGLLPTMISSGSNKKVWWKCSLGHEWQAVVVERADRGTECPYCTNQKVWIGFNDLATTNPSIASEWNYNKNQELLPTMVPPGSQKRVWWKCCLGHEWQETIVKRTTRGYGCPVCSGHKVLAGFNDLATICPDIAEEWHPTKNGTLNPTDVTAGSSKKVWWICRKGHKWQASIDSRTQKRAGCPICNQELKTSFLQQLAESNLLIPVLYQYLWIVTLQRRNSLHWLRILLLIPYSLILSMRLSEKR